MAKKISKKKSAVKKAARKPIKRKKSPAAKKPQKAKPKTAKPKKAKPQGKQKAKPQKMKPKKAAEKVEANEAPGWDAIDAVLAPIYGKQKPEHFGAVIPYFLGGPDPLTGISVYYRDQPTPHFHYVTYGFSDLYGEGERDAQVSNYGFELTFRLAAPKKSKSPSWPLNFLNNIARYVFKTGNTFEDGHHIDLNGPIALEEETEICYIGFAMDPELGEHNTPVGHLKFLQIVGLVQDEFELAKQWSTGKLLGYVGKKYPLLVTDLKRQSILNDAKLADEMRSQAEAEGSSMNQVYVAVAEFENRDNKVHVTLGAHGVPDLRAMLTGQVSGGGSCALIGEKQVIAFESDHSNGWSTEKGILTIKVSPKLLSQVLETLKPQRGEYSWPLLPNLVIHVVPSEIKDRHGEVIKTIG